MFQSNLIFFFSFKFLSKIKNNTKWLELNRAHSTPKKIQPLRDEFKNKLNLNVIYFNMKSSEWTQMKSKKKNKVKQVKKKQKKNSRQKKEKNHKTGEIHTKTVTPTNMYTHDVHEHVIIVPYINIYNNSLCIAYSFHVCVPLLVLDFMLFVNMCVRITCFSVLFNIIMNIWSLKWMNRYLYIWKQTKQHFIVTHKNVHAFSLFFFSFL